MVATENISGRVYHCQVYFPGMNKVECLASPAIRVYTPAKVIAQHVFPVTRDNQFRRGSSIYISCLTKGYPSPTISWNFIPAGSDVSQKLRSTIPSINVTNFSDKDVGIYQCVVTNEIANNVGSRELSGSDATVKIHQDISSVNITITDVFDDQPEVNRLQSAAYIVRSEQRGPGPRVADTSMKFSPYAIGAVTSAGLAVLLIIVVVLMSMRMKKRENRMREKIARAHDENLDDQEVELLDESTQPNTEYLPTEYSRLKMSWEIPRKDVRLLEQIGQGAFVEVWKGRMRRSPGSTEVMRVIIKKLQGESSDKERHFFSAELEVMKMLPAHANVIRLVGSYTANEPWLMMLELANEGTLQQFLQRHRPGHQTVLIGRGEKPSVSMSKRQSLTSQKLLALAAQVASGLDHLEKFKLIYYRLRSCKILVAKGGICKLSGFGFPNEMADRNQYELNTMPVRWAAPESLHNSVFNTKTDTWSYGIVVWEILHFGTTPYPTMGPHEVMESVQTGFRMPKPQHCSSELYEVLLRCWHTIPEERPSYQEILEVLSHLVVNADTHIDFSSLPDHLLSLDTGDTNAAF
ncbi:tyrosine kinase receptor Cad96Ca [Elysia marginata]|uniref:Tyrosine kinase receptor Cad96Ca n=1 Tax=Elysia marginata TaxID=1093978 RepID=A0AAV4IL98_9GAST|nr:tyrosine kinase receptor Cad96Ca [Elysia marginata]